MTGQELTKRLINDIENVLKAKSKARTTEEILNDFKANVLTPEKRSSTSSEEMNIATLYQFSISGELGNITQFIKHFNNQLISYSKGDNIDIRKYLEEVKSNKEEIINTFQRIIDDTNLVTYDGHSMTPLSNLLYERLGYLHNAANSAIATYNTIIQKSKSNNS